MPAVWHVRSVSARVLPGASRSHPLGANLERYAGRGEPSPSVGGKTARARRSERVTGRYAAVFRKSLGPR
jgi:hypothetical protein